MIGQEGSADMTAIPASRAGRPARVTREQVLRAAMALADRVGVEGLTMRAIGREVGIEAMSLYRHVRDKEDILDGIVDLVYEEIEVPPAAHEWKAAMRGRAISARKALGRHPWAIDLMESRSQPGPANLGHHDAVLGALLPAGFSAAMATHAYNLLDSYIYGFTLQERSLPIDSEEVLGETGQELLGQVAADRFPNLTAVGAELLEGGFRYADEFEWGLDLILDGIERTLDRETRRRRRGGGRGKRPR
jgi:AcrR family transcriptional regulator